VIADLRILPDADAAARAAAHLAGAFAREAVAARGRFTVALAGGGTPRAAYGALAAEPEGAVPWADTFVFFGDERRVPPEDPASNYRMARETLLARVPVEAARVFRMEGEDPDPDAAARRYENALRREAPSGLDLVLLGMGEDGHAASLFPETPALDERLRWVLPSQAPPGVSPAGRLTLTLPALAAARRVIFLVTGAAKREALLRVRRRLRPLPPAARVRAREATLWIVDVAAVGGSA
jgi:6-phosphogluconolactonase